MMKVIHAILMPPKGKAASLWPNGKEKAREMQKGDPQGSNGELLRKSGSEPIYLGVQVALSHSTTYMRRSQPRLFVYWKH